MGNRVLFDVELHPVIARRQTQGAERVALCQRVHLSNLGFPDRTATVWLTLLGGDLTLRYQTNADGTDG